MTACDVIIRKKDEHQPDAIKKLRDLLADLRYGSVTLVIQDGKILQIDKNEKFRLR